MNDGDQRATFYDWKKKYGGGVSALRRLKKLEEVNSQLKKRVEDLILDKQILQDVLKKNALGPTRKREMVANINMEYNISINRCCSLGLLHQSVFYFGAKHPWIFQGPGNLPDYHKPVRIPCQKEYLRKYQKSQMPKSSKYQSWVDILNELVELFFKSSRQSKRGRTWHQHVVPYEGSWAVKREGNKRITSKHRLQETAIKKAQQLARKYKADVIIHREDGSIRDRINYD